MALTIKHLNSDASFLLSFEPVIPESIAGSVVPRPFTILLDPWITGPATLVHPKLSSISHKGPACISSLRELTSPPDLVVISQHKSDHCNEATLRQLPASGSKTVILAEAATARLIRSWKYFDKDKIRTLERWDDPRVTGKQCVIRIPVPPLKPGSGEGEVTVAFIPQKRDLAGLHGAIGITYRPPPTHSLVEPTRHVKILTPPSTPPESVAPIANSTEAKSPVASVASPTGDTFLLPPTPPTSPLSTLSPRSLRSIRSASTLISSPTHSLYSPSFRPMTSSNNNNHSNNESVSPLTSYAHSRPISLIFSPHGIEYSHLAPYATSHLVSEAALPLTALLHCMDSVTNPWWLGGNISSGVPSGAEIAAELGARLWISAHDADKDVRGLVTGMLKTRRWRPDEIEGLLESRLRGGGGDNDNHSNKNNKGGKGAQKCGGGTKILRLTCGEEILVSGTGRLWRGAADDDENDGETETTVRLNSSLITETRIAPPPIPVHISSPVPKSKYHVATAKTTSTKKNTPVAQHAHHNHHHHQGKYYTNKTAPPEESVTNAAAGGGDGGGKGVVLDDDGGPPRIENAMSPRKQGIYKALRTKDLIMPSPKLTLLPERRAAVEGDLTLTPTLTPTRAAVTTSSSPAEERKTTTTDKPRTKPPRVVGGDFSRTLAPTRYHHPNPNPTEQELAVAPLRLSADVKALYRAKAKAEEEKRKEKKKDKEAGDGLPARVELPA